MNVDSIGTLLVPAHISHISRNDIHLFGEKIVTLSFEQGSTLNLIEEGAFKEYKNITTVNFTNCLNLETIYTDTFYSCFSLTNLILPENGKLTTIHGGSFQSTNIKKLVFPKSLKHLLRTPRSIRTNSGAFAQSPISSITFYSENNLETVDFYSFVGSKLIEFEIGPCLTFISGVSFELTDICFMRFTTRGQNPTFSVENDILYQGKALIFCPPGISNPILKNDIEIISNEAFIRSTIYDCTFLGSNVKQISDHVFFSCQNLVRVYIPSSVEIINQSCFCYCPKLTTVVFPPSLKCIQTESLLNCESLSSITIPSGVEEICSAAFRGSIRLTFLVIPDSITKIAADAFIGSGVEHCGITCSDEEKALIKQIINLPDSSFSLCQNKEKEKTCRQFLLPHKTTILVALFISYL